MWNKLRKPNTDETQARSFAERACFALLKWVLVAAAWLILWALAAKAVGLELLLPGPRSVGRALWQLIGTAEFWAAIGRSMSRILLGYLLGSAAGLLLGALTSRAKLAEAFFTPAMAAVKATPVASFVILLLVWLRGANLSVAVSTIMVLPLVWQATHTGLRAADPLLLEMGKIYGLKKRVIFQQIVIPPARPQVLAALRTALGFAWKAGVAGEVIAIPTGTVGMFLYNSKVYLEMPNLFAWTAVIILISMLMERALVLLWKEDAK